MVSSLNELPEEILYNILLFCSALESVAVGSSAQRFRGVTNDPRLWRYYCQTHFQYWAEGHWFSEKLSNATSTADWRALYISRYRLDRATNRLLDNILASQVGRIEKSQTIISFGYDAKDALLRNASIDSRAEDYLARRLVASVFSEVAS